LQFTKLPIDAALRYGFINPSGPSRYNNQKPPDCYTADSKTLKTAVLVKVTRKRIQNEG